MLYRSSFATEGVGYTTSLSINGLELDDAGLYKMTAFVQNAEAEVTIEVKVNGKNVLCSLVFFNCL